MTPRKQDPGRRDELLAQLVDYLLAHGVADTSFRDIAAALGVSTYPLVYHFGNHETLVTVALIEAERRQLDGLSAWLAAQPVEPFSIFVPRFWQWLAAPARRPFFRLYFEVYGLTLRDPARFPGFQERVGWEPWQALIRDLARSHGAPPDREPDISALAVTVLFGAMLALLSTGDPTAPTLAVQTAARQIAALERPSPRPSRGDSSTKRH